MMRDQEILLKISTLTNTAGQYVQGLIDEVELCNKVEHNVSDILETIGWKFTPATIIKERE